MNSRFQDILASMSCLILIAQVSTFTEVSYSIDMMTQFRVAKKHLIIEIPSLDVTSLQNKTINFNVLINHKETSKYTTEIFLNFAIDKTKFSN